MEYGKTSKHNKKTQPYDRGQQENGIEFSAGVAKNGVYVSESIKGIAKKSFFYSEPSEIKTFKIF